MAGREIIPSIIASNFEQIKKRVLELGDLTRWAQLDIADGHFAGPATWQAAEDLENLLGNLRLEAHLMIEEPEEFLPYWMEYADRILVHFESTDHLEQIVDAFTHSPCELGLVLNLDTDIEKLEPYVGRISLVQLMSISELGHYGAKLDERIYERIKQVKSLCPGVKVSIDGGVNLDNASRLVEAGADNLIVGSAIWESGDIAGAIKKFQNLIGH